MTRALLLLLGVHLSFPAIGETAAWIDWAPADQLSPAQRQALPWYCDGTYVQPAYAGESAAPRGRQPIEASANSAQLSRDQYTELIGNAQLQQGQTLVEAPWIRLYNGNERAEVDGPLVLREPGLLMTGDTATFNLADDTGTVENASFLLHEPRIRGQADRIQRDQRTDLIITRGTFTRCEPDSNTWALSGKYFRLEPRTGFGTARNVTIEIEDIPVVWVPYFRFPIDDKRHSGFLMPSFSSDSEGGTDVTIPYYFNLAPHYDATYAPRSMWKRGLIHDGQYRFLTRQTSNEFNAAFLREDDEYDDRELVDQTTDGTGTVPEFEKEDRWLLFVRHNGGWGSRWHTSIHYSAVSDTEYLEDIGGDVGSSSVQQFYGPIDQSMGNRRSAALDRKGQIRYQGNNWTYSLLVQGFQDLDPLGQEQYETLPRLSANYVESLSIFEVAVELEYANFDKDNEEISGLQAIIGQRALADTSLSVPLRSVWGFLEPSINVVHRRYDLEDTPSGFRSDPVLTTPGFSLDAGLFFDRFFEWRGRERLQTLEPRIFYLYVEEDPQNDLPVFEVSPLTPSFAQLFRENRFTGRDRIGDANQISLAGTTRFLDRTTGAESLSFSIGQIWYFKDREVVYQPQPGDDNQASTSAIFTQSRITLDSGLRIVGSYEWDHRVNRSNRGKFSLKYNPDDRHIFNLSYIFTNDQVERLSPFRNEEESDLSFIWPLSGKWSLIGRWNHGWDEHQTIESLFGVEYNDCCWKSRLVFRRYLKEPRNLTLIVDDPTSSTGFTTIDTIDNRADTGVFFEFQMKGLATLGRRLDSLLEDAIPGYREREEKIGL